MAATYAGLLLTADDSVAPCAEHATGHVLADHVRHGYPTCTRHGIDMQEHGSCPGAEQM